MGVTEFDISLLLCWRIKYIPKKWFLIVLLKEGIAFVTDLYMVIKNQTYANTSFIIISENISEAATGGVL